MGWKGRKLLYPLRIMHLFLSGLSIARENKTSVGALRVELARAVKGGINKCAYLWPIPT